MLLNFMKTVRFLSSIHLLNIYNYIISIFACKVGYAMFGIIIFDAIIPMFEQINEMKLSYLEAKRSHPLQQIYFHSD